MSETEREKNATSSAKKQTDHPKAAFSGQRGDGRDRNRDLKHGHTARENFVLMKIGFRFGLFVLSFGFDFFLLFFVTIAL